MDKRKKRIVRVLAPVLALLILTALCACGDTREQKIGSAEGKPVVMCSIFPVYDLTRLVAGDRAYVYQLLPPGADSHEYEPSVSDMVRCGKSDLFIYTDDEMEVWIGSFSASIDKEKLFRCAQGIDLEELNEEWELIEHGEEHEHSEEHEHEHGHAHKYDAHIWLDPTLAMTMAENIRDRLILLDPEGAETYRANCARLVGELEALDRDFSALFSAHPDARLYFGGKFSYSHFIRRYGADYLSAFDSCGDEEEVNLASLIGMIEQMKKDKAGFVFTDEMSGGVIAEQIARETGAKILLFHTCHTVSEKEKDLSYIDIMRRNYDNLVLALGEG